MIEILHKISTLYNDFNWWLALAIVINYIIIDGLYAQYTLDVISLKPIKSASIGSLMYILSAFGIINFINNVLYVIPMLIGSWLGTFLIVMYEKNKPNK
jgi:hypothetical protein